MFQIKNFQVSNSFRHGGNGGYHLPDDGGETMEGPRQITIWEKMHLREVRTAKFGDDEGYARERIANVNRYLLPRDISDECYRCRVMMNSR